MVTSRMSWPTSRPDDKSATEFAMQQLRDALASDYDLKETGFLFGESEFTILSVMDSYALLDRISPEEFLKDEQMPYWAEIWPASVTLSRAVSARRDLAGRSIVELGAGVGVASVAAARQGARVLATDYSTEALKFTAYNALRNHVVLETGRLDWRLVRSDGVFDVVMAADVLYERLNLLPIVTAIDGLLAPDGEAWIADPRRRLAGEFLDLVQENGFRIRETEMFDATVDQSVAVTIYTLDRERVCR